MQSSAVRLPLLVGLVFAIVAAPAVRAQNTRAWVGTALPDPNWTNPDNWNMGVPLGADTALFNGSGDGNTNISLGGTGQPISVVRFDGLIATHYTLGVLGSGDTLDFSPNGQVLVINSVQVSQVINANLQANTNLTISNNSASTGSLTVGGNIIFNGSGTLNVVNAGTINTTTLSGNITDTLGQPGSVTMLASNSGSTNASNFIISGTNTYTGPTTINVNTGSNGSIQIGSNSPFGTGQVTVNLFAANAPQFTALGGPRAIANSINLNSGMTFIGSNTMALNGPLFIVNSLAGGMRFFNNSITGAGNTLMLGASPDSSTLTLGNPVVNGGDGIGKGAVFAPSSGSTTVINDVIQDPSTGGGSSSGNVHYAGSAGGFSQINGLNTYSGGTSLDGFSTVQFSRDSNPGDSAGPFGTGTITLNSGNNNILEPIGGNRTVANAVVMAFGLTLADATGDTSGLTLSGPISMGANGRTLTNNLAVAGAGLTLGSASAPSTLTLPSGGSQTFTITGTGATTINDVIQDAPVFSAPAPEISVISSGPLALNAANTYTGDTSLTGSSTIVRIGASSNATPGPSFTAGPFGTGTVTTNSSTPPTFKPIGGDRLVSNAINMPFGFITASPTVAEDPTGPHNLTLAGPITLGATGRIITNNFGAGVGLTLGAAAAPSTITLGSTLTVKTQTAGGGLTIINDAMSGPGGFTVQGGATVQLNGTNNYAGATQVTGSKLFINGSTTSPTATFDASSTLGGDGTFNGSVSTSGTIAPGNGVGTLTISNGVTMSGASHLAINVSGGVSDELDVTGGSLSISNSAFLDVTGAPQGLSWVIASYAGTLTGTFAHVTAGYTVNYGAGTNSQITLMKSPTGIFGDFNNDGTVDAEDYVTWRKFSGTNTPLPNDNGNGVPIGPADYTLWQANFGRPPGSGSGMLVAGGSVPEPAAVVLGLLGIGALSFVPRRR